MDIVSRRNTERWVLEKFVLVDVQDWDGDDRVFTRVGCLLPSYDCGGDRKSVV